MKALLRMLRRAYHAGSPTLLHPERIFGVERLASLHPSAHLSVRPESSASHSALRFGDGVYVGKDVEIAAYGPGSISVGEDTSFQDRCLIYGDVEIGRHCIFARNVLVLSTEHQVGYHPTWLIRDQDIKFAADYAGQAVLAGHKVRIDDDCWIGWGSTVMPGVHVGRGAVIGANSVVTRDIAPYEVHGGAPNRRIGSRLEFVPPVHMNAQDDDYLPYFYRGFRLSQADLRRSRAADHIESSGEALLLLQRIEAGMVRLVGVNPGEAVVLRISVNGASDVAFPLSGGLFDITTAVETTAGLIPSLLSAFTHVALRAETAAGHDAHFGITTAELLPDAIVRNASH